MTEESTGEHTGSQLLDSGFEDAPGICKHKSGHELF